MEHAGIVRRGAAAAVALVALAGVVGCAAPSGGQVITSGSVSSGEFSIISSASYYFDGTAGDHLALEARYADGSGSELPAVLTVVELGGPTLVPVRKSSPGAIAVEFPTTGRYKITVSYPGFDTVVHKYFLRVALDVFRGPVTLGVLDGPPFMPGQMVTYTYAGTAGERLNPYNATVVGPDGTPVPLNGVLGGQITLPVDGEYAVQVLSGTGALTKDVGVGAVGLGHTVLPPLLQNQHAAVTYVGSAGEALGVLATSLDANYRVVAPGGSVLVSDRSAGERVVLPVAGTYTIVLSALPFGSPVPHTFDLWLSHDADAGAIAPGVTAPPTGLTPGQSIAYTYAGSAGETLRVSTARILPIQTCPYVTDPGAYPSMSQALYAPDGTSLSCTGLDDGVRSWVVYHLPVTGTYRLVITPKVYLPVFDVDVQSIPA